MRMKDHLRITAVFSALAILATSTIAADSDWVKERNSDKKKQARTSMRQPERLNRLLGTQVVASDGERVGKLNNLVLDLESGHVLLALVGTGEGRVALPPGVFAGADRDQAKLKISRDSVRNAPKVSDEMMNRERLSQAAFVNRVHEQFKQNAWWKGEGSASEGEFHNVHAGENLIGMKVRNVMDKNVGEVRNALVDLPAGRIVYVVVQPAKDMEIGEELVALPAKGLDGRPRSRVIPGRHHNPPSWASFDQSLIPRTVPAPFGIGFVPPWLENHAKRAEGRNNVKSAPALDVYLY